MANAFDWAEIGTRGIEKTANFYENLFERKVVQREAGEGLEYWIFDTEDKPRIQNIQRGGISLRPADENLGVGVF